MAFLSTKAKVLGKSWSILHVQFLKLPLWNRQWSEEIVIEMYITESLGHQTHENSTVLKFRSFQRKSRAFFFSEKGGLYRKKHRKGKIHKIHTCHFLETFFATSICWDCLLFAVPSKVSFPKFWLKSLSSSCVNSVPQFMPMALIYLL